MSLHYILDGYNIIKQSDFLSKKTLKDARSELVRFIVDKKPCGSINNKVTLVFDGNADNFHLPRKDNDRVEVLFSSNESADNRIRKMVEKSRNPRRIVVVSDDREIQFFVKSYQAHSMGSAKFLQKGRLTPETLKDLPKIELSHQEVAEINKELTKLWLK